ncbi:ABC-type transport system involved in multi-copper enzyme maturation permease subunit [Micromonospora pisi]|uniref:ABC-type transport system involved in multi-copper enzyme maturation permease subunit n=1 Tax=Micromonospora pisi TaxID=589240 RepID=A0A495JTE4_9ACTN|nr:ABC transporter permease subunit [Micromonospora pisi]RKR92270.1 ABC-type transport system involved in multi-copper enzyme maturation permease subunit [Micromonospora pisi]
MNALRGPVSLLASTRAELLRLGRWPALWAVLAVGMAVDILFGYVFDYVGFRTGGGSPVNEGMPPEQLLQDLLPVGVPENTLAGTPMFGGPLLLILGALAIGGGYGWGTWKTVFTQSSSRASACGGTLTALGVVLVVQVVATFMVNFGLAALVAGVESQPLRWPPAAEVATALGATLLIYAMWAAAGVLVGTLTRSPALAVGLGLVWSLAVENLLRGVANVLEPVEAVANLLPGTAAGSLAGALGARTFADEGVPGVLAILDGGPATLLLAGYTVAFAVAAALLLTRRDLA